MIRNLDCFPNTSISQIVAIIGQHVNILGPHHRPDLLIMVLLPQEFPLLRIFIAEINNIKSSSSLVGISHLVLISHLLNLLALSLLLVFHVLPSSEVTFVFLHSKFKKLVRKS